MNPITTAVALPILPETHPLFDLIETDTHYLLSIDLPTAPIRKPEIQVKDHEIRVVSHARPGDDRNQLAPLFRYQALARHARAVYYRGALWLSLPKQTTPKFSQAAAS